MSFIYIVNHREHEIAALLTTFVPRNDVKFINVAKAPVIASREERGVAIFHEKAMSNCKLTWQLSVFPVYPRRASIRTLIGVYLPGAL